MRTGQMSNEEWKAIDLRVGALIEMKLHIADSYEIRQLPCIKSEARRLSREGKLKLLVIDYLQLITTGLTFQKRHDEIGYITKELKNLAKELDIPVIVLSQLSRPQKGDKGSEPQLGDLKESGEIENDADVVIFIHKPDYYSPFVEDSSGRPWKGRGKLIIAKSREGIRNQDIIFHHDARYKKIFDAPGSGTDNPEQ
jgi:replicative DNA helicase